MLGGYFGKRPVERDFIFNGLSARITNAWADMLSNWLAAGQMAAPEHWAQRYYASPIWRFAVQPGLLGVSGWTGLITASADAIGRGFPLSVLIPFREEISNPDNLTPYLDALEHELLAFIANDMSRSEFQSCIEKTRVDCAPALNRAAAPLQLPEPDLGERALFLSIEKPTNGVIDIKSVAAMKTGATFTAPSILSYWWHDGDTDHNGEFCICRDLPDPVIAARFFLGDLGADDWRPRASGNL